MSHLPPSLTRHSSAWFVALTLGVIGDISSMLATFMPMKTVLILASGEVPGFFPTFLVEGGAVFASLVLLAAAGVFGVISWLVLRVIAAMDQRSRPTDNAPVPGADWSVEATNEARATRNFETSAVLLVPIAVVLALVSVPYLVLSLVFVGASALTIIWRVRRSTSESPYFSGVDQVSHELAGWLKSSALWSMVALALVTLLIAPPALGSTAILIAAIFGRRLTVAVADLVPRAAMLATEQASKQSPTLASALVKNQPTATVARFPIDYLSTIPGSRKLGAFLESQGYGRRDFRIVGVPRGPAVSVVAGLEGTTQILLRIFGTQQEQTRQQELGRRQQAGAGSPYPAGHVDPRFISGFPSLLVRLEQGEAHIDPDTPPSLDHAIKFQLRHELGSMIKLDKEAGVLHPTPLRGAEIVDALQRVARLPGKHRSACDALIPMVPDLLAHIETLPLSVIPSKALGPRDCAVTASGDTVYLGGHSWALGRSGDRWGHIARYEKALHTLLGEETSVNTSPEVIVLNAEVMALHRALLGFELPSVAALVTAVQKRLRALG